MGKWLLNDYETGPLFSSYMHMNSKLYFFFLLIQMTTLGFLIAIVQVFLHSTHLLFEWEGY